MKADEFAQPYPKPTPKPKRRKPVPECVVDAVFARSRFWCECSEMCVLYAEVLHHRLMRSQGGKHTVENIAHVSQACHLHIHANPAESYRLGLLIRGASASPTPQGEQ